VSPVTKFSRYVNLRQSEACVSHLGLQAGHSHLKFSLVWLGGEAAVHRGDKRFSQSPQVDIDTMQTGSGHPIPKNMRELLVYHFCVKTSTVDFVMDNLFLPGAVARNTIERIRSRIISMSPEKRGEYIDGLGGCPDSLLPEGSEQEQFIRDLISSHRTYSMHMLTKKFHEEFYPAYAALLPSLSTVYRAVRLSNTRKRVNWTNVHKDPIEQVAFLGRIAHVAACRLVDIDGMVQTPEDFYKKFGWSPKGEECRQQQIFIGGRSYAVHAAFTELGFLPLGWKVFPNTVTETEVREFVETIKDRLPEAAFGLFDNASNQRTNAVRVAIEAVFNGYFMYCSPYSPELKPIERGFSLVKRYIREHEADWEGDDMGLIDSAFHHYSMGQEGGLEAYNLFRVYRENPEAFLQQD
jgi:hypothetical protein